MLISKKLNNSLRMLNKHIITPSILLLIFGPVLLAQTDGEDIVVGNYRKLNSEITKEERTLLVRLPRDYSETSNNYPVLYLLYGQNINEYLLPAITACDLLAETGSIPEMIIVGIANAERYRDYSSISDGYIKNTVQFFTDELFPFINENYRTNEYRIIVGPQAGAVFAFYVLINHPDMFNAFIIENPFVGQNRELIFSKSNSFFANNPELEKFLFISEENNNNPLYIETARKFSEMLISKKPAGFKFSFKITEPSNYFVPPVPVKEALLKLFEPFAFPDSLKVENLNDIKEFYDNVSRIYNIPFKAPNIILTFKSDDFVNRKLFTEARELLAYQLSLYPKSLNALMRLGDLERMLGNYENALRFYDEFLKIMPVDAIAISNRRKNLEKYVKESLVYLLEKDIRSKGIDQAVRNFKRIKSLKENKLGYPENDFNNLGYSLLNRGMTEESVRVFRLAIEIYPRSANLFDSLGEAYINNRDVNNAIKSYERSLSLNPQNDNAKKMLEQLRRN
jgi:predicted alpha/beta superfamily hydrolase